MDMNTDTFENQGHSISCPLPVGGLLLLLLPKGDKGLPSGRCPRGEYQLITSSIHTIGYWCLYLLGHQWNHFSLAKSHMEHMLSSCWQFWLSSWGASKVKCREWKCLFLAPMCFPCSKSPTFSFKRKAQSSNYQVAKSQ